MDRETLPHMKKTSGFDKIIEKYLPADEDENNEKYGACYKDAI